MKRLVLSMASLFLGATMLVQAGEKQLMHCFAFTPIASASQADWDAFYKATDMLPSKIPVVKMVWAGKLNRPLTIYGATDAEARKKAMAGQPATSGITATRREYGVCMAMQGGPEALKAYSSNPYHKEWMSAYEKVRVAGTTTYDIIGQ